jgi:ABC-type phosphate transport system permease subunit
MGRRSMAGSAWILRGEGKESMRSPVIVFDSSRHAFHEFRQLKVVAIMVLLGTILVVNSVATVLRTPYDRRW